MKYLWIAKNKAREFVAFIFLTLICAVASGFPCSNAWGKTYEIVYHAYCSPNATTQTACPNSASADYCCNKTEKDLKDSFRNLIHEVNLIWEPTGVSFRSLEKDFEVIYEDRYSIISSEKDPKILELASKAYNDPARIHIFILGSGGLTLGWSSGPYGAIFTNASFDPIGMAHELGHHLCVGHTHSGCQEDCCQEDCSPTKHDGDLTNVTDTPPDPGPLAGEDCVGTDIMHNCDTLGGSIEQTSFRLDTQDELKKVVKDHEWCEWVPQNDVDPGSFYDRRCDLECFKKQEYCNDGGQCSHYRIPTDYGTLPNVVISYYMRACTGPYVLGGTKIEAFTQGEIDRIKGCMSDSQQQHTDVCKNRGGDTDHDGICDNDDRCPDTFSFSTLTSLRQPTDKDSDGDGIFDLCDNCPTKYNPDQPGVSDMDGDGAGDACDPDDDNDGCPDDRDKHPYDKAEMVGWKIDCDMNVIQRYAFAGIDTDNDGLLNCEDTDSDNDEVLDDDDVCPVSPENDKILCTSEPAQFYCILSKWEYELLSDPWARYHYFVKLVDHRGPPPPEPVWSITFDNFTIRNDTIYVQKLHNMTVSETARALTGSRFNLGGAGTTTSMMTSSHGDVIVDEVNPLTLEIWSRSTNEVVEVLDSFSPEDVILGEIVNGRAVAVKLRDGLLEVNATWGIGLDKEDVSSDLDGDGVPDPADDCIDVANPRQEDIDQDGFGDACDPDFDQNGVVSETEVQFVRDCEGVNLEPYSSDWVRGDYMDLHRMPSIEALKKSSECRAADLNHDGVIDAGDITLTGNLFGKSPGPSGIDRGLPAAESSGIGVKDDTGGGCGCMLYEGKGSITNQVGAAIFIFIVPFFYCVLLRRAIRRRS